jgi:hypothetical protein
MPIGVHALARVTLRYFDIFGQKTREASADIQVVSAQLAGYDAQADIEVRRNATIVRSAETLRAIDGLWQAGQYEQAWIAAAGMERELRDVARLAADPQLVADADLFRRYQLTLASALGYVPEEAGAEDASDGGTPSRWGSDPALRSTLAPVEVR